MSATNLALDAVFYIETRGRLISQWCGGGGGWQSRSWPCVRAVAVAVAVAWRVPDLRFRSKTADFRLQTSGTDIAETAKCAGNRRQPCGMGGIPSRFLSICCASSRLTRSQGGHEA